jgi:hypothetical protein
MNIIFNYNFYFYSYIALPAGVNTMIVLAAEFTFVAGFFCKLDANAEILIFTGTGNNFLKLTCHPT